MAPKKKTSVTVSRPGRDAVTKTNNDRSFFEKLQGDLEKNNSFLNLVLGTLIVIVLGVLMFNYFNKPSSNLGPSQQAENTQTEQATTDVAKENLPGQYTIKDGDTLYYIAEAYYNDGYKYDKIMAANNMPNPNLITVGQVIEIPKLSETGEIASVTATTAPQTNPTVAPEQTILPTTAPQTAIDNPATQPVSGGQGGAENQTIWGEKITTSTYVVQEGDWLSKIAGRAYGDIYQYDKLAQTNNIPDPNNIAVGTVIQIPR
jgi:nucleoid-associated protein YgaU